MRLCVYTVSGRCSQTLYHVLLPLLVAGCATAAVAQPAPPNGDNLIFDTGVLDSHGIDPRIAEFFRHAPRFLPGESSVVLTVNGNVRGRVKMRFDDNGTLCADGVFQRQAGLVSPPGYDDLIPCFDLRQAWPLADVQPDPGEGKVTLVVPPEAIAVADNEQGNWQHGGVAGMFNYNAQYLRSSGGGSTLNFGQLTTEAGLNAGDWIVRSRQTFSRQGNQYSVTYQDAYAQRSFVDIKKVLQVGQVSLSNSLFGTGQVLGFQMFPESALTMSQDGAGLVEDVADTQSVVEVSQSGVLVYSTVVPAGPFRLQGFSLLNTHTDLEVTLTGSNGQVRRFTVPAATLLTRAPQVSPGLSFGAGRLEQQGSQSPLLGTIARGWKLTPFTNLNAGLLGSTAYRAGSINLETQLLDLTRLSLQSTLAQDADHGNAGTLLSAIVSHRLSERLNVNINGRQQTSSYRELSDALRDKNSVIQNRSHYQWGTGIGWSVDELGSFSLSWARSTRFDGSHTDYLRGGWGHRFGRAYLGASLERNTDSFSGQVDDRLYVSFSMPLGAGRHINSYLNTGNSGARTGIRYSDRTSQDRGWSIASDRDLHNNRTSVSGTVDFVTPVSQLGASLSRDSDNSASLSAHASGATVFHDGGITFSPYRVGDTFGIARVGKESGVRLSTPAGTVWTDGEGYAVLPMLNSYRRSGIQLDTRSLTKNIDIGNAWQETEMARGAIGRVDFEVLRTRRVMVEAKTTDNKPLPYGASVFDDTGKLLTVVGDHGSVFVSNAASGTMLEVQNSGKTLCSMTLNLPEKLDESDLYENTTAVCR